MVTTGELLVIYLGVAFLFGLIGLAVGNTKNRGGLGFVLGFFLGIIGVLIAAVMSPAEPPTANTPGGWWPDPFGRHTHRYYDGTQWTADVADNGEPSKDPPVAGVPLPPPTPT